MGLLSYFERRRRDRALKLYDEARECIDDAAYDEARKIARKLRKLRFTGAFEIEALALSGEERDEDAVRVLREGIAFAPDAWPNWHLLGCCLSNLGRYDEAQLAYDRAATATDADPGLIALNRAIVETRREDFAAALRYLDTIHSYADVALRIRTIHVRVTTLQGLDRDKEADDLAARTIAEWRDTNESEGKQELGALALDFGERRLERGDNRLRLLLDAVAWWRATRHDPLLSLVRELHGRRSPDARYYRLMLHGKAATGSGYYTWIDVVADSPEEGLALYIELAPKEDDFELSIEETHDLEARPDGRKGVYSAKIGRAFYERE